MLMRKPTAFVVLLFLSFLPCLAQQKRRVPSCRAATFAGFKPLPKLSYECPQNLTESDDKILACPSDWRR